jgi:uncharacterized protein (TIRG00374 family)
MKYWRVFFQIVLLPLVVISAFYYSFRGVEFLMIWRTLKGVSPWYPAVFIMGLFFQYLARGFRWGILLRPLKKDIKLSVLVSHTALGFFLNLLPGKIGEPARGIMLARREKIGRSPVLASVVLERMFDLAAILFIFAAFTLLLKTEEGSGLHDFKGVMYYVLPVVCGFFLLFYLINLNGIFSAVERGIRKAFKIFPLRIRQKLIPATLNFIRGLRIRNSPAEVIGISVVTLGMWLAGATFQWILLRAFVPSIGWVEMIPFFILLVLVSAVPTPGMAGTMELGGKMGLMALYGISASRALAFTLLYHFLIIFFWFTAGLSVLNKTDLGIGGLKKIRREEAVNGDGGPA